MTVARTHPLQIATVLVYLSDVEDGGETSFLLEGKEGLARLATIDYKACDTGIKVCTARSRTSQGCWEGQGGAGTAGDDWLHALQRRLEECSKGWGSLEFPLLAWGPPRRGAPALGAQLSCSPLSGQVKPKQGDALLFWNTHVNGTIDKHSLHGGCPVVAGTKWAMTKW